MLKRKAVDQRRFYTKEEKNYILSKTNGRCAHCGKKLTIKTMQKDHSIPWSKGGVSDVENIVPLCETCNNEKADRVLDPTGYFRYIKKPYLKNLQTYFDKYLRNVDYLNMVTLFPVDAYSWKVGVPFSVGGRVVSQPVNVSYRKAGYCDLDEIYEFLLKYNEQYCLFSAEGNVNAAARLKEEMTRYFLYGCIMYSRMKNGELASVVIVDLFSDGILGVSGNPDSPNVLVTEDGREVERLAYHYQIFLNPRISFDSVPYAAPRGKLLISLDASRFYYYGTSLDFLSRMLVSEYMDDMDKDYYLVMTMPVTDPRAEKLLMGILCTGVPEVDTRDKELQKAGNVVRSMLIFSDNGKDSEEMRNMYEKNRYLADFIKIVNGERYLYEKISSGSKYSDYIRSTGRNSVLLHQFLDEKGLSAEEGFQWLVDRGYFILDDQ